MTNNSATKAPRTVQFYIRDAKGFPIACVHVEPVGRDQEHLAVGFSVHNPIDRFDRKLGRDIATGRSKALASKPRNVNSGSGPRAAFWMDAPIDSTRNPSLKLLVARQMCDDALDGFVDVPARVLKALKHT
jgi:hypothetical protein